MENWYNWKILQLFLQREAIFADMKLPPYCLKPFKTGSYS